MAYEPKLDPSAVVDGYLNADPKAKGEIAGYMYGEQIKKMMDNINKEHK
jgi:hypothetical protein